MHRYSCYVGLFFLLIFATSFSFAYEEVTTTNLDPSVCATSLCLIGACQTLTLSQLEVQSLWDNFLYKASKPKIVKEGQEALKIIDASTAEAEQSKKGPPTTINEVSKETKLGLGVDLTPKSGVDKTNPLNNESCNEDYAFAMILKETIRVGRCVQDQTENCSVLDSGLVYSNDEGWVKTSEKSITSLFGASKKSVQEVTEKGPVVKQKPVEASQPQPSSEESFLGKPGEELGPAPEVPDIEDPETKEMYEKIKGNMPYRVSHEAISNSVLTQDFAAHFMDNCSGSDASDRCKIYVYSFFDKYYNSYFSGSLVVTTAGPAVMGLGSKFMKRVGLESVWKKNITDNFKKALDKIRPTMVEKYEVLAKDSIVKLRGMGVFKGMDDKAIADFEKAFGDSSGSKLLATFDSTIIKNLDTPEKKKAFVDFAKNKLAYSRGLNSTLPDKEIISKLSPDELMGSAKALVEQDDAQAALGHSVVDLFYEKQGAPFGHIYINTGVDATVPQNILSKPIKKKILNLEINLEDGKKLKFSEMTNDEKKKFLSRFMKFKKGDFAGNYHPDGLDSLATGSPNLFFAEVAGEAVPISPASLGTIKAAYPGVDVPVYKMGGFTPMPYDEAKQQLTKLQKDFVTFGKKDVEKVMGRSEELLGHLKAKGVAPKAYANWLNYALYNDKWTLQTDPWKKIGTFFVAPTLYWKAKTTEGSPLKAYFVGEKDMSNIDITTGQDTLYSDAYIDFFVNKSFFSGDLFGGALAKMAKVIGNIMPSETPFETGGIGKFMGVKLRTDVKDVVFYTTSGDTGCENCSNTRNGLLGQIITVNVKAPKDTKNYILEYPDSQTFAEGGLSLAAFTHHTNIKFETGNVGKGTDIKSEINIAQAIVDKETCVEKVATSFYGKLPVVDEWFKADASRVGLATGIMEMAAFYVPSVFIPGIGSMLIGTVGSVIIDLRTMEHFAGCVDTEEGYFIHYVHGFSKAPDKTEGLKGLIESTDKEKAKQPLAGLDMVNEGLQKIKDTVVKIVESKDAEFLQIEYETLGDSYGKFNTGGLFLSWVGPRAMCNLVGPPDKDQVMIAEGTAPDGNKISLKIEGDTLSVNGKQILKNPLVSLNSWNLIFGGIEIPQSVTFIPADLGVDYFQITPIGEFKVLDPSTEMCIKSGITKQTGYNNPVNIIDYTGPVTRVNTLMGTQLDVDAFGGNAFMASGGIVQRIMLPESIIVDSNVDVVSTSKKYNFGTLGTVAFTKAILIHRQDEKDFVLWIRILAQIHGNQVQQFKAQPVKIQNPETNCDETAFDLSITANPMDAQALKDAEAFNAALKKAGPFQYFETPDKIIIFYSKLENGQCKEYMKVVDKKTNKVISDAPIDSFEKTANGFKIKTADGKTHELEFSNEGGTPMLSYNGEKAPLLLAQGRNGSFYFDPDSKDWYVGNSQMLPFDDKFATEGRRDLAGITTAGGNPVYKTPTTYGKSGIFDIPLFDLSERFWFIFASLLAVVSIVVFSKYKPNKIFKVKQAER